MITLNTDVIAAVQSATHCRIAVYPAVRCQRGERVLLEVADCPRQLGYTSAAHEAGHYLVQGADPAAVLVAVNALRSPLQRRARLEVMPCSD